MSGGSARRGHWGLHFNYFKALLYATNVDDNSAGKIIASAIADGRSALSEIESKRMLATAGIPVAMAEAAATADAAAAIAGRIGYPVVLKVLSPEAVHKSEVGGVALNLGSEAEVREAFARIEHNLAAKAPGARFDGVAVQPMAQPGVELIAGVIRDSRFGPMVIAGLGGIFVEVLKDTTLRLAPTDRREAEAMIAELRGGAILDGVRGNPAVDRKAFAELIVKLSELAAAHPAIAEMDLNPVAAYADGVKALDARILLSAPNGAPAGSESAESHARRVDNLRRAFEAKAVAVIGDKRMGGYMWLRAMKRYTGHLYSVQIDPNEIPGIEAMGVTNYKSLAEVPETIDYAVSAVPR
ncbi:MAG: acetate--CoA ligase family protein, partial [Candidatus Binataceae bacterium]